MNCATPSAIPHTVLGMWYVKVYDCTSCTGYMSWFVYKILDYYGLLLIVVLLTGCHQTHTSTHTRVLLVLGTMTLMWLWQHYSRKSTTQFGLINASKYPRLHYHYATAKLFNCTLFGLLFDCANFWQMLPIFYLLLKESLLLESINRL